MAYIRRMRRNIFFENMAQTSTSPPALEIISADGCKVMDVNGKEYLDFISGISVSSYGHGNVSIRKAIRDQVDRHLHIMVYGEHILSPQVDLVEALIKVLPPSLQSVYLTNSGAEATEGAMKLAKRYTGRTTVVSFRNSYHGSTQGALSICGNEELKNSFRPLIPGNIVIDFNSTEDLEKIDENTAAVFMEPIQAEAGIILPDNKFSERLKQRCVQKGVLLVLDEIQTGMGRTGRLFAYEELGITPDILLLGKAFGGGMPLGAFISSKDIMMSLTHDPALGHLTTSGGHPVSCAAALAGLKMLTDSRLLTEVKRKETILKKHIRHPKMISLRGKGLFFAIEFENESINKKLIEKCFNQGLLTDWFLFNDKCLRIAPPLIISEDELIRGCEIINDH